MVINRDYATADGAGDCQRCGADSGRYVPVVDACLCSECFEIVRRGR